MKLSKFKELTKDMPDDANIRFLAGNTVFFDVLDLLTIQDPPLITIALNEKNIGIYDTEPKGY